MTTGSQQVTGTKTPVATGSGAGFLLNRYKVRSWSGTDRIKLPYTYEVIDVSHENSYLRVRKGKKYIVIKYKPRFLKRRVKPPASLFLGDHPYSTDIRIDDDELYYYQLYVGSPWYSGTGANSGGLGSPTYSWDANDEIALLGKLREKIAGSDFNAGVAIAEGHEALKMIASSATKLYWGYRAARQGDFRSARRYLLAGSDRKNLGRKTPASNWLELQYGWLPLLKDAEGAAQFLAQQLEFPLQQTFRATSSKKIGSVKASSQTNFDFLSKSCFSRGQYIARIKEKDVAQLSGLTDPLSIAWEAMPYSFVIDWFIPIGNYLSARGLSQSLTGTFVKTVTHRSFAKGLTSAGSNLPIREGRNIGFEHINLSRSVSSTLQVPLPTVKPLGKIASWAHAANAVSLLTQLWEPPIEKAGTIFSPQPFRSRSR